MRKRLAVIVSVSPFEPEEVVLRSANWIKNLDFDDLDCKIVYAIDSNGEGDRRGEKLRSLGFEVFERADRRGRKAGAINDCLDSLMKRGFKPDYVAFFDVDSRPSKNFVVECIRALEKHRDAFISSSERRVINANNLVAETLDVEYRIFNFLLKRSDFKNFNGLIGVVRADLLIKHRLDESSFAEDLEFSVRMHALGYKSVFVENAAVYEQAPTSWRDLYKQRKRWYYGGLQLFRNDYLRKNKVLAFQVLSAVVFAHAIALLLPLLIIAPPLILYRFRKIKKLKIVFGLVAYLLINQIAAMSSLYSFLRGREIEWQGVKRVEQ